MRTTRTDLFCYLIVAVLLSPLTCTGDGNVKNTSCDASKAENQCGENGRCVQDYNDSKDAHCECERNFHLVEAECVPTASTVVTSTTTAEPEVKASTGGSSVAAGLLIPTFLILIGALLFFAARRYKWLQRFRQYRQNRYGNVLVTRDNDDDDVPPIP